MAGRIQAELRQSKPLGSLEEEAFLNVVRTAEVLARGMAELLKPYDLSPTQYNVLRILRGAGREGLACRGLGERLITHDPDITRLLDRLEKRRLITRRREEKDRRVVTSRITPAGLKLLAELDAPVAEFHQRQLRAVGKSRLRGLVDLLEEARAAAG